MEKLHSIQQIRESDGQVQIGLCHNDPFPNNFLDDGNVRLIDWEYAGMGDIMFDLSCVCSGYSRSQSEDFLTQYFGHYDTDIQHSLEQMNYVVTFWNAMWAVLQTQDDQHTEPAMTVQDTESAVNYRSIADELFAELRGSL